ncbi:hypothetical protein GJAV_G00189970 [Gymnothorax javanicus]|nr:hypothetical protein GJAV_G00189970 [Gymnothorax javanicus]
MLFRGTDLSDERINWESAGGFCLDRNWKGTIAPGVPRYQALPSSPEYFLFSSWAAGAAVTMETTLAAILRALLLLIGGLEGCFGADVGCAIWLPSGPKNVCCKQCHPGNRLEEACGLDPKKLCVPCDKGTYITGNALYTCRSCRQCTDVKHKVKQSCTSVSDTVCECEEGYRCVDAQCSSCTKECGLGQEPSEKLKCRPCPEGTFNDQIHQKCKPWSTSCSLPGQQITELGTAVHDSICGISNHIPIPVGTNENDDGGKTLKGQVALIAVIAGLSMLLIGIITFACTVTVKICKNKKEKAKTEQAAEKAAEGPQWEEQPLDCSLCHPQQEEGGSLDSIASQGSKDKLLPV